MGLGVQGDRATRRTRMETAQTGATGWEHQQRDWEEEEEANSLP